jgi:beta-lactamase class A
MGKLSRLAALSLALLLVPALIQPGGLTPPPVQTDLPRIDTGLQESLENVLSGLRLDGPLRNRRLAVSLVDITSPDEPRYAGINDREMMYAASLPKIAILLAGFEKIAAGRMRYTRQVKEMFTRMVRFSSNGDASQAVQKVGFDYIAKVMTSPKYRLYDRENGGGLWIGKAYGGPNDYWRRDPLHNISHGATSYQVARYFLMLEQGRLVSSRYSAEMKDILSQPAIHHKFVKGLDDRPNHVVYRKSGSWRNWHADAALVEAGGKKYIAVALMEDPRGGEALVQLIRALDDVICDGRAPRLYRAGAQPAPGSIGRAALD